MTGCRRRCPAVAPRASTQRADRGRWKVVDLKRGELRVNQGLHWLDGRLQFLPPKTRRSRRTVPLPALCADALREHRKRQDEERATSLHPWPDTGLVFVSVVGDSDRSNNFSRTFARWCREAGVPAVRLHDTRHTCVSLLLSLGVHPRVVMEIVGHAGIEMTMNRLRPRRPGRSAERAGSPERAPGE
jgi:integrase